MICATLIPTPRVQHSVLYQQKASKIFFYIKYKLQRSQSDQLYDKL